MSTPTTAVPTSLLADVQRVREQIAGLHAELTRYGLVAWTAGNISGRVQRAELFVIKPSGVSYDALPPEAMVVCSLDGSVVEGDHTSSSDSAAHAYVYRHRPDIGGVVHTHSTSASAWGGRAPTRPLCAHSHGRRIRR